MRDLEKYCEYLYSSLYIPIYIYNNKELIVCYPVQNNDTLPPWPYLEKLWDADKIITFVLTTFYSYYGCIKIEGSNNCLVIGPINDIPYTRQTLFNMRKEYNLQQYNFEDFSIFFNNIPTQNLDAFINTLLFINYSFNNTQLTKKDITDYRGTFIDTSIDKKYVEVTYTVKEEGFINNNYTVECELLRYIETGNLKELQAFSERVRNTKVGIVANDTLRHLKNTFIVTVSIVSRAAMKGGLSPNIAYELSNIYIKQVELLTDNDSVLSLMTQVQYDYANRVANSITPAAADSTLYQVIKYVRENTNKNITVSEIANHLGFSRSYLSKIVKKELGFNLSDFIRRCKLEESKDLLAFSEKSISMISNYLCFSSQSHFQRAFKEKYGITPHAYRKSTITSGSFRNSF